MSTGALSSKLSSCRHAATGRTGRACQTLLRSRIARRPSRHSLQTQARYGGLGEPSIPDRLVAAVPYLLPLLHSFQYGRFLLYTMPVLRQALSPVAPLLQLYNSVPFAHMIAFFGIYIGIANNTSLNRFVRFNAMQAMLLDVVLVLPALIEQLIELPRRGPGLDIYIWCNNAIWIGMAVAVVFGILFCLLGKLGKLPLVGDAAEQQLR